MSSNKSAPIEQAVLDLHEVQYELTATAKMLKKPPNAHVHVNDLEEMASKVNRSIACIQRTLQAAQKILAEGIVSDEGKPK